MMFSTITTVPSTTIPKSKRPEREQVGGNMPHVQTNRGEQQRERNGQGDDQRAADVAQQQEQHKRHQDEAFGEVVQNGMGGEVNQVAAVDERNDLHPGGRM